MSEGGKKTSIYVADPVRRARDGLREAGSMMTLSARVNEIVARYWMLVDDLAPADFTDRELFLLRTKLPADRLLPTDIRYLDELAEDIDARHGTDLAGKVARLDLGRRLALVEALGL